ncbi:MULTISPECIES: hypothetical protein [unclassified Pseudomonas]|uniref:hypothetical protein n=1 Tax=unclassified Pseudomonas TaxID=196821 RepID=UPI000CD1EEA1|nr:MULTISPECIES: hypothetical protein [unclassified Pseudomonas]POA29197.1 hypothetical protein C1887_20230 [Pseudomonas sp. GW456-R21]POA61779.1 hypothetical protein C1884_27930 [Pseudomonas sp. GW460-R15]
MSLNVVDKVLLSIALIDLAGIFLWIGVCLHLAYTKMDLMLEHLKSCSAIMSRAPLRHGGPWGKLLLVGGISGIVTFPGFYLKRGELSSEDLANFPASIKRKLAVMQWSVIWLLLVMISFGVAVKLGFI